MASIETRKNQGQDHSVSGEVALRWSPRRCLGRPDDKGFLGKAADTTTGLTHIGAREYDRGAGLLLPKVGKGLFVR